MDKETIFKEIRRGQVLLWAGAGFSRYAGYPMGAGVVERLYRELSEEQRRRVADSQGQATPECPRMSLPDFAQLFVNLHYGSRERLVEVLTELFSATPTARDTHDQLAAIAYLDTIVTTNYDPLFELAYGSARLHVVTEGDNVPQIGRKPVTLFKIHGELSRPRSLVITRDDYHRFSEHADVLVWTQLKALMGTRTIVFVGYAVEDPNVLEVFLSLVDKLGALMRPAFVVGPSMDSLRIEDLRRKNVHFIQASGEQFVEEFLADTKKKALPELAQYGLSVLAPVSQTLNNMGLDCRLKLDGSGPLIDNITRREGPTNFELSFSTDSTEVQTAFQSLTSSRAPGLIKLPIKNIQDFAHKVEGFTMPTGALSSLWVMQAPHIEKKLSIRFESGLLLPEVDVSLYQNQDTFRLVALSKTSRVDVKFTLPQFGKNKRAKPSVTLLYKMKFARRAATFATVAEALESTRTMLALGQLERIEAFEHGQLLWSSGNFTNASNNDLREEAIELLQLVDALPIIELRFGIMFQHFSMVGQDIGELLKLSYLLSKKRITANKNQLSPIRIIDCPTQYIEAFEEHGFKEKNSYISYDRQVSQEFAVLGWRLNLTWVQKEYMFKPVFEKVEDPNTYAVHSGVGRLLYECLEVIEAKVIHAPQPVEPSSTSEERLKERLPLI